MIDEHDGTRTTSTMLTDDAARAVVDECYQCKLCYVICPYTPEQRAGVGDRLPAADAAVARDPEHARARCRASARLLARTDLQGKVATTFAPSSTRTNDVEPVRVLMEKVTGIARGPAAADVRAGAVLEVVPRPRRRRRPARHARRRSRCSRRASSSTRTRRSARRWSVSTSATASRATCPRPGVLRHAVARRRRRREVPRSTRERNVDVLAAGGARPGRTSSCRSPRARTC